MPPTKAKNRTRLFFEEFIYIFTLYIRVNC